MKVLNAEQTRNLEKNAVRSGISYLQLMENAGAAAARFIKKRFPVDQKHIVVLCGKGNNGGDGFVAARHLAELGAKVIVVLTEGQPGTEIAREMFEKLSGTTVKTVNYLETPEIIAPMLSSADYIVDAIYGIGFHGSVPEYLHPLFIVVKARIDELRVVAAGGALPVKQRLPQDAQAQLRIGLRVDPGPHLLLIHRAAHRAAHFLTDTG